MASIISEEDVKNFLSSEPSVEKVESLGNHELKLVAKFLELEFPSDVNRFPLVNMINRKLFGIEDPFSGNFPEEIDRVHDFSASHEVTSEGSSNLKDPCVLLELEKIRLEQAKLDLRREEMKLNHEFRIKQLESNPVSIHSFDVARQVRLVPPFCERDVTKYFVMFEKVAQSLCWPKEYWPILLQSVLKGKAQSVYASLSNIQCVDYDIVKNTILKSYELVPEAYRLKYRNTFKLADQTYVEFARVKEDLFNQWLRSKEVKSDFVKLKELMLLEEFARCVPKEVSLYLSERGVDNIAVAAIMADEYVLTHKTYTNKFPGFQNKRDVVAASHCKFALPDDVVDHGKMSKPHDFVQGKKCKICNYCGKTGHWERECWKKSREIKAKSVALVSTKVSLSKKFSPVTVFPRNENKASLRKLDVNSGDGAFTGSYDSFMHEGTVSLEGGEKKSVQILRDTGALKSLMLKGLVDFESPEKIVVHGVGGSISVTPVRVYLECEFFEGFVCVGLVDQLPMHGVHFLLGNDIAGNKVNPVPLLSEKPVAVEETKQLVEEVPHVFPACAVTRSMSTNIKVPQTGNVINPVTTTDTDAVNLADTFFATIDSVDRVALVNQTDMSKGLIELQQADPELQDLAEAAVAENECDELSVCYYLKRGVLMRKWRPHSSPATDSEWVTVHQVVVPNVYRYDIMKLAHDSTFAGHLGVRKTLDRIWRNFYWPTIRKDVSRYCRTCHTCQMVGKPNQPPDIAPLIPIPPFDAPFSRVVIDIVGPLPKTATGYSYILTIMDMATRYPEAVPLKNTSAKIVVRELLQFFTRFGLPKEVQSDQGSNFMSKVFRQSLRELGIEQITSTAYHPQSQGAIERYHQTLKSMITKFCTESHKDWDKGLPFLLFATRETPNESLGFSPFELMFTHEVRGPLKLLKEEWLGMDENVGLLSYVSDFKEKLNRSWKIARDNLVSSQKKMKKWYDKKARMRVFQPGDQVLVLLPIHGQPLQAKFSGPYLVKQKLSDVNYVVSTPDRRKSSRLCHINMLKPYYQRDSPDAPVCAVALTPTEDEDNACPPTLEMTGTWEKNTNAWTKVSDKLTHLTAERREEFVSLLSRYQDVFRDTPGLTTLAVHDVNVGDAAPVKQAPYRVNPNRLAPLQQELNYMLEHGLIEACQSEWCSPVTLVPKSDGGYRFCIDFRKVNALTKTDTYPLPRVDECIDKVGSSNYISKFDLLKGYWQVPLTDRAQDISCFVTLGQTYKCKVMPYGMKNAPATFQRLMNTITAGIKGCVTYIDDVVVYSDSWEEHISEVGELLNRFSSANLVVNLEKCEFVKAQVQYLGYVIGQGSVAPPLAKVESICRCPRPQNRKELQRYLGMIGYYRMFILNFTEVVAPLTDLLKKGINFEWSKECELAFDQVKAILSNSPVLQAPNFSKPFKLAVDASNVGAGAVLLQEDDQAIDHPVCYFSKKFNSAQKNYSTIEKELLSLILGLQHFAVYLNPSGHEITVFTDHHPLKYLNKFRDKNQRLTRWSLYLQEFHLNIIHIKGKDNVIADCLSRL